MFKDGGFVYLLSDFLGFVSNPSLTLREIPRLSIRTKVRNIFIFIAWVYAAIFPLAIVITFTLNLLQYEGKNAVEQFAQSNSLWNLLLLGAVLAPFIEEMTFRLWLRFDAIFISLSSFLLMRILVRLFSVQYDFLHSWYVNVILLVITYLIFMLLRIERIRNSVKSFYDSKYKFLFYASFISFGLLHIFNYSDSGDIASVAILITLPQIIVGIVLGYVRVHYGFWYAFLMHALYNSVLLIPASLARDLNNPYTTWLILLVVSGILLYFVFGVGSLGYSLYQIVVKKRRE